MERIEGVPSPERILGFWLCIYDAFLVSHVQQVHSFLVFPSFPRGAVPLAAPSGRTRRRDRSEQCLSVRVSTRTSSSPAASTDRPQPSAYRSPEAMVQAVELPIPGATGLARAGHFQQKWDLFSDTDEVNDFDPYSPWEVLEQNMLRYDPTEYGFGELFVYASCHWIEHFGAVSFESLLPALDDIELVCQAGSKRLSNWITQNSRPDCTIKPRFTFDPILYDPLSITSIYGSEAILQRMLEHSDLSNHTRFLPGPAMGAADQILEWGDLSRVQLLWRSGIGHQIRNKEFFKLAVKQWSNRPYDKQRSHWDTVFGLVNDLLDVMVSEGWANELFSLATKTGCAPMARLLMDAAQHQPERMSELLGT